MHRKPGLPGEWPSSKRNTAHAIALNACRAALVGEIDAETARGRFNAFVTKVDLLIENADAVVGPRPREMRAFGMPSTSRALT
ncbi:DUF982 domain-containing protein [Sinorhizobium numidicum]|uniref:DUF982 domain-containing protein n=1 Tax=Sinorhizobium numidicum TaxID=680248 RepID=UPI003CC8D9FA